MQGGLHLLHALSEHDTEVTTMVLAMGEVVVSAAGSPGCEDIGFLPTGFFNFYMSIFFLFSVSFLSLGLVLGHPLCGLAYI